MPDTAKDVPAKGSMGDLDGGEIGILEMMGRAGLRHLPLAVLRDPQRSSRRQQDLGFHLPALPSTSQHFPAQQTVFPTRPTTRSNTCVWSSSRAAATGSTARGEGEADDEVESFSP